MLLRISYVTALSVITVWLHYPLSILLLMDTWDVSSFWPWKTELWSAWLAQSVEHVTLDLGVVSSNTHAGCRDCLGMKLKKKKRTAAMNVFIQILSWTYVFLFLGKYLGVGMLGHREDSFRRHSQTVSQSGYLFIFPQFVVAFSLALYPWNAFTLTLLKGPSLTICGLLLKAFPLVCWVPYAHSNCR